MKRALKFGSSAGCMLGGMLGVYDAFRVYPGEKFNIKLGLRNISRSLPWGLFTMGGYFLHISILFLDFSQFTNWQRSEWWTTVRVSTTTTTWPDVQLVFSLLWKFPLCDDILCILSFCLVLTCLVIGRKNMERIKLFYWFHFKSFFVPKYSICNNSFHPMLRSVVSRLKKFGFDIVSPFSGIL